MPKNNGNGNGNGNGVNLSDYMTTPKKRDATRITFGEEMTFAGLLSFMDETTFPLDSICLCGPNASGKSSLFYIFAYILYGEYSAFICNNQSASGYGRLTFFIGDAAYTIRRDVVAGKSRGKLLDANGRKCPAAKNAIEKLLGVDFTQFVAMCTLRSPFTEMTSTAFSKVLQKQFDLTHYESAFRKVNADLKATTARITEISAILGSTTVTESDVRARQTLNDAIEKRVKDAAAKMKASFAKEFGRFEGLADADINADLKRLVAKRATEASDLLLVSPVYAYETLDDLQRVRRTSTAPFLKGNVGAYDYDALANHFERGGTWSSPEEDVERMRREKNHHLSVEAIADIDDEINDLRDFLSAEPFMVRAQAACQAMADTSKCVQEDGGVLVRKVIETEMMEKFGQITAERITALTNELADARAKVDALREIADGKAAFFTEKIASFADAVLDIANRMTPVFLRDGSIVVDTPTGVVSGAHISGYERVVVELALRTALHQASQVPVINFCFLDESFDCFDKQNVSQINEIASCLTNTYETVIVVSHSPLVRKELPFGHRETTHSQ